MPKINTHLHLAIKLSQRIKIDDLNSFYLGNAFPDSWNESIENTRKCHYFKGLSHECDLELFLKNEEINDFNLGYYFHLWVDNHIRYINVSNISKYDCLICDIPIISSIIEQLKLFSFTGKELKGMNNILSLESEPVPLYLVPIDKKKIYEEILDRLVDEFLKDCYIKEYENYRNHRK